MRFGSHLPPASTSPPSTTVGDAELVRQAQHHPEVFASLYLAYRDRVLNYCSYRLSDPEESEDAASAIFMKALHGLSSFRDNNDSFRSWLFRIAHNEVADRLKHDARHPVASLLLAERLTDPRPSPEDIVITADATVRVRALLETLPPRERSVLELRLADLSCQEIAAVLGIGPQAVWSAQSRALGRLRSVMATELGEARIDG